MPTDQWRKDRPGHRPKWGTYDWEAWTAKARKKPGEWILVDENAAVHVAPAIRQKKMVAFRSDEWEYDAATENTNPETKTAELWISAVRKDDK